MSSRADDPDRVSELLTYQVRDTPSEAAFDDLIDFAAQLAG
jgi:hypothetical protein